MSFLARLVISLVIAFVLAAYIHQRTGHRASLYDEFIREAAAEHHIDPLLIKAVIWCETEFDPHKIGAAQERGLMQVTPTVGAEWAAAKKIAKFETPHLSDPRTSIEAGSWYLSRALHRWRQKENPIPFALAEYNAGRTHALRWSVDAKGEDVEADRFIQQITFPSTQIYVKKIIGKYADYRIASGLPVDPPKTPASTGDADEDDGK